MRPMYIVHLLVCSLVACAAEQDIAQVVMEEPADVLAGVLPPPIAGPSQSAELLPATMTNQEATALAKADGYDPRDNNPLYAYTSKPGDVSYMPGEFSTPQALLVGWSSSGSGFKSMFAEIIAEASHEVPTTMIYVTSNTAANSLYNTLLQYGADTSTIHFAKLSLDSIWIRDYGPLVTRTTSGGYRVIDTRYYYGRWQDDVVPTQLASAWGLPASRPPIEMEGGNFQSDGAGTCITTTVTLQQNGYTSSQVKQVYKDYLGCSTSLILPRLSGEGAGLLRRHALPERGAERVQAGLPRPHHRPHRLHGRDPVGRGDPLRDDDHRELTRTGLARATLAAAPGRPPHSSSS